MRKKKDKIRLKPSIDLRCVKRYAGLHFKGREIAVLLGVDYKFLQKEVHRKTGFELGVFLGKYRLEKEIEIMESGIELAKIDGAQNRFYLKNWRKMVDKQDVEQVVTADISEDVTTNDKSVLDGLSDDTKAKIMDIIDADNNNNQ